MRQRGSAGARPGTGGVQRREHRDRRAGLGVIAVAVLARALWSCWAEVIPVADMAEYDRLALGWLTTGEFGDDVVRCSRTPLYPGFLACLYALFGHDWHVAGLIQALLAGVSTALVMVLGARVGSPQVGLLAGLLYALCPSGVVYTPLLVSEHLGIPLLAASVIMATSEHWSAAGLLVGLVTLVRPAGLLFLPGLTVAAWSRGSRAGGGALAPVLFLVVAFLTVTPWVVRNDLLGRGPIITSTIGFNLWMGNHDGANGGWDEDAPFAAMPQGDESQCNRLLTIAAAEWIRAHPGGYLRLCLLRANRLLGFVPDRMVAWWLVPIRHNSELAAAALDPNRAAICSPARLVEAKELLTLHERWLRWGRLVTAPLSVAALCHMALNRRRYLLLLLPCLSYIAGVTLTFAQPRFAVMLWPLLLPAVAEMLLAAGARARVLLRRGRESTVRVGSEAARE